MPHFKKHPPRWILVSATTLQPVARVDDVPWYLISDWCQRVHGATITVKAWSEATTREQSVAGLMRPLYLGDLMAQERVAQQAVVPAPQPTRPKVKDCAEKLRQAWKGESRVAGTGGSQ